MEDNFKVKVKNRAGNGSVGYTIPDMGNLKRVFSDGEEKIVTYEEIRKLSYIPGGSMILKDYLIIQDKDVLKELNFNPEVEYFYDKKDIIALMQHGSLDEFLDCLDFAPEGVKESIKNIAVELPLNDVAKRNAIQQKLGFNVTNAIENLKITEEETETDKKVTKRRAAVPFNQDSDTTNSGKNAGRRVVIKQNN